MPMSVPPYHPKSRELTNPSKPPSLPTSPPPPETKMRIRRHANLDVPAGAGAGAAFFRPSLCVLNQSPWDVLPFSPDSPLQGFWVALPGDDGVEDEVADWEAGADGTPSAVGEVKEEDDPSQEQHHLAPISMFRPAGLPAAGAEVEEEEAGKVVMCAKRGGKGWRCGNEARKGGALCDHHAALRQCYSSRPQPAAGKSRRRAAAKPGGGGGSDYYYYSGFGPRWRKRRGKEPESGSEGQVRAAAMPSFSAADSRAAAAPATESGSGEGSGGEGGRRRRRKPMKKRSLMSLL